MTRDANNMLKEGGTEGVRMVWDGAATIAVPLTIREWEARDLPEPDFISGQWLSTTSRALVVAPTGLGKTNFVMGLG